MYGLRSTIFKGSAGKRLVRWDSMLRWLTIFSDSQPKQISPQSGQASAHISNTRHAAALPRLMFLLEFLSSSLAFYLQGIGPFISLVPCAHRSPLWGWNDLSINSLVLLTTYCGNIMVELFQFQSRPTYGQCVSQLEKAVICGSLNTVPLFLYSAFMNWLNVCFKCLFGNADLWAVYVSLHCYPLCCLLLASFQIAFCFLACAQCLSVSPKVTTSSATLPQENK